MATQAERRATTRAAILEAATELFADRGYEATSISDVLERSGVSRGALYHHFASKEDVFATVFVTKSSDAIRRAVARSRPASSPFEALVSGCLAWLDIVAEPPSARIVLVDGPVALGWSRATTIEEATSLGVMRQGIRAAVESGEVTVPSVELAAQLVNAVVAQAALRVSVGGAEPSEAAALVRAMLGGLRHPT